MAKKKLNKKVALVGSMFFLFLAFMTIVVILYLTRDPDKFIKDGDDAAQAARAAVDAEIKTEEYKKALRNYHKARGLAKTDSLKIEMLFKAVDIYLETDDWRNALGCWNTIILLDSKNVKARYARLKYYYILADSGAFNAWQEVASQASEFLDNVEDSVLAQNLAEWESFAAEKTAYVKIIEHYLRLARARAALEMTNAGAVTDPEESLALAENDLEKLRELIPDNPQICWYLAQVIKARGQLLASRGSVEEKLRSAEKAEELLTQALESAGDNPRAHINLTNTKLQNVLDQRPDRQQIQAFEPEYLSLVEKFPSSAEAFAALAKFYDLLPQNLDKAIKAIQNATSLDPENATYAIAAASFHYRRFYSSKKTSDLENALQIAQNALTLPDAQDKPGPWQWANRSNRIMLFTFLANCYCEQVLEPIQALTSEQKKQYLTNIEYVVHEIEQLYGSGQDPQVIKWRAMLQLVTDTEQSRAVRQLYAAYEQMQSSGRTDAYLAHTLAKFFENSSELGAVAEFLASALRGGISRFKPQTHLEYAELLLKFNAWMPAIASIDVFEENFGPTTRSNILRIKALTAANQFDQAEEKLAQLSTDDPNTVKLRLDLALAKTGQLASVLAQRQQQQVIDLLRPTDIITPAAPQQDDKIQTQQIIEDEMAVHRRQIIDLASKLLDKEPNLIETTSIEAACESYIAERKTAQGVHFLDKLLEHFPNNATAIFYKKLFAEVDPQNVSAPTRVQIEKQVRLETPDAVDRALAMGIFYQKQNELGKAAEEFKKVVGPYLVPGAGIPQQTSPQEKQAAPQKLSTQQILAASYLFDIALANKDWELAENIETLARTENLDHCEGNFFAARALMSKNQYNDALTRLDEAIRQRPVFSQAFMLRSTVNAMLGNQNAAIQDIQKASSLNPLDKSIAIDLAVALYSRNERLGDTVTSDQVIETQTALINAIRLNPTNLQLQSWYAEFISKTNPEQALAIRQRLLNGMPNLENALLLARMALRIARDEVIIARKNALLGMAESAFRQARGYDPQNPAVLNSYAEYLRLIGENKKAEEMLTGSEDKTLLWEHYYQTGQLDNAATLFEQLHKNEPNNTVALKGLILIAEKNTDTEAVQKYFQQLLAIQPTIENQLFQVQTFLKVGLIKDAEQKLQSFRERYPQQQQALLLEAWLSMKKGQLENALASTNQYLQNNPDSALAWRIRGQIYRLMADYQQAIIDLKKSKSLDDDPATRLLLAKTYTAKDAHEDAITELKSAMDDPQSAAEASRMLEKILWRLGRTAELSRFYNEIITKSPNDLFWYNQAGKFALAVKAYPTAEQLYQKARDIIAASAQSDQNQALEPEVLNEIIEGHLRTLLHTNDTNRLFAEAGKYLDGPAAPVVLLVLAEAKMASGDRESAVDYCQKALDKTGTDEILAYNILQRMNTLLGREHVMDYCNRKLRTDPDSLAANYALFSFAKINGEYNKAVEYIDKCLAVIEPDSPRKTELSVEKARVLQSAYSKTSDTSYLRMVIQQYESLLEKMPNNTGVLNNLAYMLAEENVRLDDALAYARRAHNAKPDNPDLSDTYAFVLYRNNRAAEAAELLQAALQQYELAGRSVPADTYEHLGMVKEKLGADAQALDAYKQALQTAPEQLSEKVVDRLNKAIQRLSN
ncbi:MAG TPA: tetratricopeptide repeat protein [Sedimentisphaerales bacterium]|nr:tetratricopeptide repeat protein [Sedimentisphaerales bacterium]